MGIARDWKISEILERLLTTLRTERACQRVPSQNLRDFDIEQVRGVQCLALGEEPLGNSTCSRGAEQ